jgi:hypothetical protein
MVKVKYDPQRQPAKGPVHGMSIYDAAHYIVCIVKPAPMIYPSRLSGQYMTILSARGVPDEVFLELQQDSVKEALKVIGDVHRWWDNGFQSRAGVNGRMQLAAALETAGGLAISVKKQRHCWCCAWFGLLEIRRRLVKANRNSRQVFQ